MCATQYVQHHHPRTRTHECVWVGTLRIACVWRRTALGVARRHASWHGGIGRTDAWMGWRRCRRERHRLHQNSARYKYTSTPARQTKQKCKGPRETLRRRSGLHTHLTKMPPKPVLCAARWFYVLRSATHERFLGVLATMVTTLGGSKVLRNESRLGHETLFSY